VLYIGLERWSTAEDISGQIRPEPPQFLRAYQPQLRDYLIDAGRSTSEQLSAVDSPLSGIIQLEIASGDRASLQAAVDRLVRLIQADPNKVRFRSAHHPLAQASSPAPWCTDRPYPGSFTRRGQRDVG
jgi:hypothetical protein